jgi:hypothetical protein
MAKCIYMKSYSEASSTVLEHSDNHWNGCDVTIAEWQDDVHEIEMKKVGEEKVLPPRR